MTKRIIALVFVLSLVLMSKAQSTETDYTILLTGASFGTPNNGWFEIGAKHLKAKPINKAVEGSSIADTANKMASNTLYSPEELEAIDALVIMHVHEKNVADFAQTKESHTDYNLPFDRSNYAAAYDYTIKKYLTDCYNLKFDENSKYYNTLAGKPAVIILCTHWHDARVIYNTSVRQLADRWGFPLIEFDKYIGFSKQAPHPVTKEQTSALYTNGNNQTIHDVVYGFHPDNGQDKYIQQRMAAVFVDTMKKVLPLK